MNRFLATVAVAASLTACTANQPPSGRSAAGTGRCFNAATINDFHAIDRHRIIVTAGVSHHYLLDILGTCPEIDWSLRIGLRSTSGSSWVCQGQDAELLVPGATGIDRCPVLGVRPISIEEAKALRAKSY